MLVKSNPDEFQSFLEDASNLQGGYAERVLFPETSEEIAEILVEASRGSVPVTVSGAGTGVVGGRVPFGGIVIATDRFNRIKEIKESYGVVEAGVRLIEFQRAVEARGLLYPPDPTERSCYIGATVATNSSGARSFKYGATRSFISGLKIVLATGDILHIKRGEIFAKNGILRLPLANGSNITIPLPTYRMPNVSKHASGYYITPDMDAIDLFIGSEGTLGVVTEIETKLIPKPASVLSGLIFFSSDESLLNFVNDARATSFETRANKDSSGIDARALEYFDEESLNFLRGSYPQIPDNSVGAIFFEQEINEDTEDLLMSKWLELLESNNALIDQSWFGINEQDHARIRDFRHHLPVLVNEWLSRHKQRKVSTDMCVPINFFPEMMHFYRERLTSNNLKYVIFGHIGDNHVHVNILPRDKEEALLARDIYLQFIRKAVSLGGTISAEHGIGKLKRDYLRELYSEAQLREMVMLKRALDPAGILGRGNIFPDIL
jgi:D-lactate dehydrogenase (cytochrome)